jgi:hypothetical protein
MIAGSLRYSIERWLCMIAVAELHAIIAIVAFENRKFIAVVVCDKDV